MDIPKGEAYIIPSDILKEILSEKQLHEVDKYLSTTSIKKYLDSLKIKYPTKEEIKNYIENNSDENIGLIISMYSFIRTDYVYLYTTTHKSILLGNETFDYSDQDQSYDSESESEYQYLRYEIPSGTYNIERWINENDKEILELANISSSAPRFEEYIEDDIVEINVDLYTLYKILLARPAFQSLAETDRESVNNRIKRYLLFVLNRISEKDQFFNRDKNYSNVYAELIINCFAFNVKIDLPFGEHELSSHNMINSFQNESEILRNIIADKISNLY
jgi:hypothetical protein